MSYPAFNDDIENCLKAQDSLVENLKSKFDIGYTKFTATPMNDSELMLVVQVNDKNKFQYIPSEWSGYNVMKVAEPHDFFTCERPNIALHLTRDENGQNEFLVDILKRHFT